MPGGDELRELHLIQDTGFMRHEEDRHVHAELVYLVRGSYRATLADGELVLRPGQGVYYPPGCRHHPVSSSGDLPLIYCLQWSWAPVRPDAPQALTRIDDPNARLQEALGWLWNLHTIDSPRRAQRAALLEVVLLEVIDAGRYLDDQPADPLTRVHRYIHENLFSYWGMRELVAVAEVSEAQLRRSFVQRYGIPPVRLAAELRRQHAVTLIRGTRLPFGQIARRCRYSSSAHLSRVIRRSTGRCPRELRRQYRAAEAGRLLVGKAPASGMMVAEGEGTG